MTEIESRCMDSRTYDGYFMVHELSSSKTSALTVTRSAFDARDLRWIWHYSGPIGESLLASDLETEKRIPHSCHILWQGRLFSDSVTRINKLQLTLNCLAKSFALEVILYSAYWISFKTGETKWSRSGLGECKWIADFPCA